MIDLRNRLAVVSGGARDIGQAISIQFAKCGAEMHVFVNGGHAFGLRRTESPITRWPHLVETWLAR